MAHGSPANGFGQGLVTFLFGLQFENVPEFGDFLSPFIQKLIEVQVAVVKHFFMKL